MLTHYFHFFISKSARFFQNRQWCCYFSQIVHQSAIIYLFLGIIGQIHNVCYLKCNFHYASCVNSSGSASEINGIHQYVNIFFRFLTAEDFILQKTIQYILVAQFLPCAIKLISSFKKLHSIGWKRRSAKFREALQKRFFSAFYFIMPNANSVSYVHKLAVLHYIITFMPVNIVISMVIKHYLCKLIRKKIANKQITVHRMCPHIFSLKMNYFVYFFRAISPYIMEKSQDSEFSLLFFA